MRRYLEPQVRKDLARKMVFLGGPRQVGKTTLAQQILHGDKGYLSWDVGEHREAILKRELPDSDLLVFDELHKHRSWRNYLKGLYDQPGHRQSILVTGSAQLDLYGFGGDSLQGRYHYLRLHPLSVAELRLRQPADLQELLVLGGFPEPFLGRSEVDAVRWSREYRTRLIREDITSLEAVRDLGNLELLLLRLPEHVGRPPVGQRVARGPAGRPQDGGTLAGHLRKRPRDIPPPAVQTAREKGGQKGAQALSPQLGAGA